MRTCLHCGKEYKASMIRQKWCSASCRCAAWRIRAGRIQTKQKHAKICSYCSRTFETINPRKQYCSDSCRRSHNWDKWERLHPDAVKALNKRKQKRRRKALRQVVMKAYGGKCSCCGETQTEFLSLHHIQGGGKLHRKQLKGTKGVYIYLRANGYPPGYEVLCYNCHMAHSFYGYCPHWNDKPTPLRLM